MTGVQTCALPICSVLTLDDQVDEMNDAAFYALSSLIKEKPELTPQSLNALIIARNLERVGDHATNIAEDVIFWVQGSDVRHNASNEEHAEPAPVREGSTRASGV